MQKHEHVAAVPDVAHDRPVTLQQAVDRVQLGASSAEKMVRRYPLASIGLALGAGIAMGAAARHLLQPKPKSMLARFTRLF